MRRRRLIAAIAAVSVVVVVLPAARATVPSTVLSPTDWRTYGYDQHHTFHPPSTALRVTNVATLHPKWFFRTGDSVTAQPVKVGNTVYVGSWDGRFYAIDAANGAQRWKFDAYHSIPGVTDQKTIAPSPETGRTLESIVDDTTTDGGYITSSAWFEPGDGQRPDLVIFGGGYTLFALRADTGALFWAMPYTGKPELPPDPTKDEARIFASPVVYRNQVLFAVTPDGQRGYRGYIASANLNNGQLIWRFETDVDATTGALRNDGCGGVWSSPTVDETNKLVFFGVADCHFDNTPPYDERILAINLGDPQGTLAWKYDPPRPDEDCDFDFGATVNYGSRRGTPFIGVGGKDGTYYALDPATGAHRWHTRVVFGGFAGGFLASTAFDGERVYGATALGDFGRFEGFGQAQLGCALSLERQDGLADPRTPDTPIQEPSMHALNASDGTIAWQMPLSQSFAPTTVAGGMTFVGTGITREIQIRDAATGVLLHTLLLPASCDSGVAVSDDSIYFGLGSSEQGVPTGVMAWTTSL